MPTIDDAGRLAGGLKVSRQGTNADDGWYWIWDDPSLSVHEKAVTMAVYRKQFRGNPVLLTRKVIGELASVSRSQVIRCEKSLAARGVLAMLPTKLEHVFLYRVRRVQLDLFPGNSRSGVRLSAGLNPASVENAVDNNGITAYRGGTADRDLTHRAREPEKLAWQVHIETEELINSKDKTRAEVRPRGPKIPGLETEQEQRRRIEARDARLAKEQEARREIRIGAGPSSTGPARLNPKAVERIIARGRRQG